MAATSYAVSDSLGGDRSKSAENESGTVSDRVVLEADGIKVAAATPLPIKMRQAISAVPTVTVAAAAHVQGHCVGGLIDLGVITPVANGSGVIDKVVIGDKDHNAAALDIWFFNANPTASTFTSNAAGLLNIADMPKVIGVAHMTDFTALTLGVGQVQAMKMRFVLPAGQHIWAAIIAVASGGATYTATNSVTLKVDCTVD